MQTTEKKLEPKSVSLAEKKGGVIRSSASIVGSEEAKIQSPSVQLSKDLAGSLMTLIKDVNKEGVTPETVHASCNAASQIYKILRLNFEMKKEGF